MSNPGVITLYDASSNNGKFRRFVLEDNIGESIHLHIDNMRIDFTIEEFLEFSKMVKDSLIELDFLGGYSINIFDEHFLKECAYLLPNLQKIAIEEIELSKLNCIVRHNYRRDLYFTKLVPISNIPAYKYLKGKTQEFLNYGQYNYFNINNKKRLFKILESIQTNSYPYKNEYIVLFNGQNIIRDGQHRAAILAHLYGLDYKVKVMRFYFKGHNHLMKVNNKDNFTVGLKWFLKRVYRQLKRYLARFFQNSKL